MLDIPSAIPRAALVTGGAKRLGRAMALALAGAGFDIALHYRRVCLTDKWSVSLPACRNRRRF